MRFILPAPPSVNAMYRSVQGRVLKSKAYRVWLKHAQADMLQKLITDYAPAKFDRPDYENDRLSVQIDYYPNSGRHRDLDNLCKPLLDLFQGHVYKDDRQIDFLSVTRRSARKGLDFARVEVFITPLG